jgi:uncharacterized protein YjdB
MGGLRSLIFVAPALLAACDGDQGPRTPAGIVVTPNRPQVPMGGTRQLTVTVVDADGRATDGEPVAFESAEPDVVTVSEDGLLISIGSLDTVTITAASGSHIAEIEAEVVPPPSTLTVSPTSLKLAAGEFRRLYIIVTDENGDSIPGAELVLEIDDPAVAVPYADGLVFGQRSGVATISVINGERRRDIPVTVTP